jgi:thiamine transporter ThiT
MRREGGAHAGAFAYMRREEGARASELAYIQKRMLGEVARFLCSAVSCIPFFLEYACLGVPLRF